MRQYRYPKYKNINDAGLNMKISFPHYFVPWNTRGNSKLSETFNLDLIYLFDLFYQYCLHKEN